MPREPHISLDIVDISGWAVEEAPLTGSRAKNTVVCPEGNSFVFKEPKEKREAQIWSEVLASFIAGDLLGWPVQTSRIAVQDGVCGNLHGYIYDHRAEQMVEGWRYCLNRDPDFDLDRGTRHTLRLLSEVAHEVSNGDGGISVDDFFLYWARALALDTLISNGDRHAENWAVIHGKEGARMAPLYDNGSSLGCGIDVAGLQRWFDGTNTIDQEKLNQYKVNGRHHLRLDTPSRKGGFFNDVNTEFLRAHPRHKESFQACLDLRLDPVESLVQRIVDLKGLPDSYCITDQRAEHLMKLLQIGQDRIRGLLSGGESE